MIPAYVLEQIRERVPIEEVAEESLSLKRIGSEMVGLCPFHQEKTPSFYVVPRKQFYHCFGCGAHGDVISLLMHTQKLTFLDAVKQLAGRAGIGGWKSEKPVRTSRDEADEKWRASVYLAACAVARKRGQWEKLTPEVLEKEKWAREVCGG